MTFRRKEPDMKRRLPVLLLLLLLTAATMICLSACKDDGKETDTDTSTASDVPSAEPTDAPTEEPTAAPTEAATGAPEAPTQTEAVTDKAEKSGCGSILGSSAVLTLLSASAFAFTKKKHA